MAFARSGALNADGHPVWIETRYDGNGNIGYVSQPWRQLPSTWDWSAASDYTATGTPIIFWTSIGYDAVGRLSTRTNPNGSTVTESYNGREATATASTTYDSTVITQKKRTVFDPLGRIGAIYNNEALGAADERDTVIYTYNASGCLAKVNAAGVETTTDYDNRGLPTTLTDPNAGSRAYSFNAFGELYKVMDAKTQTTTFDYDMLGRMVSRRAPEGWTGWTYDIAPGKGKGLLASVDGVDGAGFYTYDDYEYDTTFSRVSKLTRTIAAMGFVVRPTYDGASRLQTVQYEAPDIMPGTTEQLKYLYNDLGAMREIRDMSAGLNNGLTVWSLGEVNAYGQPLTEILGNGVTTTSLYSASDGMLRTRIAKTAGTFLEYQSFGVDGFGNVRKRQSLSADGSVVHAEDYGIDLLNRLTSVKLDGVATQSTQFDSQGNIKNKSDVGSFSYDDPAHPHAVTTAGGTSYAYDANGNRTQRNGVQEAWWTSFDQPTNKVRDNAPHSSEANLQRKRCMGICRSCQEIRWSSGSLSRADWLCSHFHDL